MSDVFARQSALKNLMTGLIYPAVLGSILYSALDALVQPQQLNSEFITLKYSLVSITVVFYCCDYLYILVTRAFDLLFFLCDCVFIVALLATVHAIGFNSETPPNLELVFRCYLTFIVVYLGWDLFEFVRTKPAAERHLFVGVILWEIVSAGLLLLSMFRWTDPRRDGISAVLVLSAITIAFATLTWKKKNYYYVAPTTCVVDTVV